MSVRTAALTGHRLAARTPRPNGRSRSREEVALLKARLIRWFYTVATLAGLVMVMSAGRKWKVPN